MWCIIIICKALKLFVKLSKTIINIFLTVNWFLTISSIWCTSLLTIYSDEAFIHVSMKFYEWYLCHSKLLLFHFPGMLTITDFIKILQKYYKSPLVSRQSTFLSCICKSICMVVLIVKRPPCNKKTYFFI